MMKADFKSLRGDFKFNTNHYPIQDFYLVKVAKRADGKFETQIVEEGVRELRRPPRQGLRDEVRCSGRIVRVSGRSQYPPAAVEARRALTAGGSCDAPLRGA